MSLMSEPVEETLPKTALVLDDEAQIGTMVCKVLSLIGIAAQHFTDPIAFLIEIKGRSRSWLSSIWRSANPTRLTSSASSMSSSSPEWCF